MKKNFVKVVFFGALALSTVTYVGCKDYDDDVENLQEQINKINAKEPGVSTEAMNSAIQSAVASLKAQLETVIAGKANDANVQALQTKVNELVATLSGKADQAKVNELIAALSSKADQTQVNELVAALSGKVDQARVDELVAALSSKADQTQVNALVDALKSKADQAKIDELVAALGSKADQDQVDALVAALSGKADQTKIDKLIAELSSKAGQEQVDALVAALDGKADAEEIIKLVGQITALSQEVNNVKGSLAETKANLEAEIASLKTAIANVEEQIAKLEGEVGNAGGDETPEDTSLRDQLNKLTADLAAAQNELAEVNKAAENNAAAITTLTTQIAELTTLKEKINALEAAHANFVQTGDLAAYYTKGEILDVIDMRLVSYMESYMASYMTSEEVKSYVTSYVDETVRTQVLTEITKINERMDTFNAELAKVSQEFATYRDNQTTAYNNVIERIDALEDYKQSTLEALVETVQEQGESLGQAQRDLANALGDIQNLKEEFAKYATNLSNVETEVKAYADAAVKTCTDELTKLKDRLDILEVDVDGLKNMIQSVTFVPEYTDGEVQFSALILKYTDADGSKQTAKVGETNNAVLTFRVSPVSAAAKFANFYDVSFDEQPAKTRATNTSSIFSSVSEPDLSEAAKGLIKYTVTISATQSHVVCLNVTKKKTEAQDDTEDKVDYTDINSNYFPVVYYEKTFDKVRSVSPKSNVSEIVYDDPAASINYGEGSYYETQVDNGAWTKLEGFDLSNFSVVYEKKDGAGQVTDATNLYELNAETGILRLTAGAQGQRGTIGKTVTVSSTVNINGINSTSYQLCQANAEVTAIENEETVYAEFNLGNYEWADVINEKSVPLNMVTLYNAIGYSAGEYEAGFTGATVKESATSVSASFTATSAVVTIDAVPNAEGEKVLKYVISFKGTEKKLEVTVRLTINTPTDEAYKLKEEPRFLLNGEALFNPSVPTNESGVVTGAIGLTKDLKELFTDYATTKAAVEAAMGEVKFEIVEPVAGVSLNDEAKLVYDPTKYTGATVRVRTSVTFGNKATDTHEYDVALVGADKLSGTWVIDSEVAKDKYTIDNNNKTDGISAFAGHSWVDGRSKVMWKNGSQVTETTDFSGVEPLAAYHLSAPTFEIVSDDKDYFNVDGSGNVTLTEAAKQINGLTQDYTVIVRATVKSPWGKVANTGNAGEVLVKVTIPKGFTY